MSNTSASFSVFVRNIFVRPVSLSRLKNLDLILSENKANGLIESLVNEVAVGFSQGSDHLVHDTSSIEKVEEDNGSGNKLVEIRST